jgi:AcrR family transcriptional regulator
VSALPLINAEPPERADAARNRRLVLDAARRLFEQNPGCVTMEAVAAEAGVGKGTVFRRFGDRASLARAVISEYESELVALLLEKAGCGERAPYLADVVMAPLAAPTFIYHRRIRGLSLDEQIEAFEDLVNRLTAR